ncbi:hypothetical protein HK098_004679 [Nowakowskiella sp. JEL0407]|nr:hypothetical protein HK098_004679 [Nowakowskiella sp. JEL0407]
MSNEKYFRSGLGDLTPNNLLQLKLINEQYLPSSVLSKIHNDTTYKAALKNAEIELVKLAYFNDVCCGGIITSLESFEDSKNQRCDIISIAVLQSYRKLGVASLLLDHVFMQCKEKKVLQIRTFIPVVGNEQDGLIKLLESKSFEKDELVDNYYGDISAQIYIKQL